MTNPVFFLLGWAVHQHGSRVTLRRLVHTRGMYRPHCHVFDRAVWVDSVIGCVLASPLCQDEDSADYQFDDGLGHTYFANICGNSKQRCLPPGWLPTFEMGVAVQFFGDTPPCNYLDPSTLNCIEKVGQMPACCTSDCQVLGVGNPTFSPMPGLGPGPNGPQTAPPGVIITYDGSPPDDGDPFWCPWNPSTGQQYPRQVSMYLSCDYSVDGPAAPLVAVQNSTEDCQYVWLARARAVAGERDVTWSL